MSRVLVERSIIVGIISAAGALFVFGLELGRGATLEYAQVAVLTKMVVFQTFHVGNCRSEDLSIFQKSPFTNPVLLLGVVGSLAIHVGAMYFPPTQFLIRLRPLDFSTWAWMVLVSLPIIPAVELHKLYYRSRQSHLYGRGEQPA